MLNANHDGGRVRPAAQIPLSGTQQPDVTSASYWRANQPVTVIRVSALSSPVRPRVQTTVSQRPGERRSLPGLGRAVRRSPAH
jgi:hypothetical protein